MAQRGDEQQDGGGAVRRAGQDAIIGVAARDIRARQRRDLTGGVLDLRGPGNTTDQCFFPARGVDDLRRRDPDEAGSGLRSRFGHDQVQVAGGTVEQGATRCPAAVECGQLSRRAQYGSAVCPKIQFHAGAADQHERTVVVLERREGTGLLDSRQAQPPVERSGSRRDLEDLPGQATSVLPRDRDVFGFS